MPLAATPDTVETSKGDGFVNAYAPLKKVGRKPLIYLDSRLSTLRSRATAEDGHGND